MEISVIGLGLMGSTLAKLLLKNGHQVTVWNRTPEKATALAAQGASVAKDAADAVRASALIVVSVSDYVASKQIFAKRAVADGLTGHTVLQLSTGSPRDADAESAWIVENGAEFLAGTIQAAPSQMGQPDTPILVSGPKTTFQRLDPVLKILGGSIQYLGERASLALAMDLATLSYIYGSMLGVLHGAAVAESEGLDVDKFGALVANIAPSFGRFLLHETRVIKSADFKASESPLRISVSATERIAQHARDAHLYRGFAELAAGLFSQAEDAGYADLEAAALIKLMRSCRYPDPQTSRLKASQNRVASTSEEV